MSFTFNNYNCETFGLYVERYPDRQIPAKQFDVYSVPGKSGKVYVPKGGYTNVTQTYRVYVKDKTDLSGTLSKIAAWMLRPDQPVELRDSYNPGEFRLAMFMGGGDWANSLNLYGRTDLSFDCGPQRYDYPRDTAQRTISSGASNSELIGTGSPKGNGYIDDPQPVITLIKESGWSTDDEIVVDITNTITSETTRVKLTCTTAINGYNIVIDTQSGTIYLQNTLSKQTKDITDNFAVEVTGNVQMRFTYQVSIDVYNNTGNTIKYSRDPRWYRI